MPKPAKKKNTTRDTINDTITIEVETFLAEVAKGDFGKRRQGQKVFVNGTVNLRRHPLREKITELPEATIAGDLIADGGCALRVCRARVSGMVALDGSHVEKISPMMGAKNDLAGVGLGGKVSARGCLNLRKISGLFHNDVSLDGSSIEEIGADFLCGGVLSVEGCGKLRFLDCTASSVIADESSLEETGPNATIENFSAEGCRNLSKATPILGLKWVKYDGSGVTEVHPNFTCKGPAYFKRCRKLTNLAGQAGSVEVSMAPLERVGNLRADNGIIFTDCNKLPTGMGGMRSKTLVFARCDLEELPSGIHPDTAVRIGQCPNFSKLPAHWRGEISLTELPTLRETPKRFKCTGKFSAEACENLNKVAGFVGGDLHLMGGLPRLASLDDDLEVGGDLWVSSHASLLNLSCKVRGTLTAREGTIQSTGAKLEVGGDADFYGSTHLKILRGKFNGKVDLDETSIEALGADLEVGGDLSAKHTPRLTSINCTVGGIVAVEDSGLRRVGPAFQCGKGLRVLNCPNFKTAQRDPSGKQRIGLPQRKTDHPKNKAQENAAKPLPSPSPSGFIPPNRVYPNKWFAPGGLD